MRVLVVEDEVYLAEAIQHGLRLEAIAADLAHDGEVALEMLAVTSYDAVVLDRDLPRVHGDEVARHVVEHLPGTRVIMLTAADRLDDKESGFGLGADDYLTKPFALRELVLRLRALARRPAESASPVVEFGGLRVDPFRREVFLDGRYVNLTRKQFSVLEVLVAARGGVVSAERLLEQAWDENADPFTNAVRITVSTLRKRLGEPQLIETVAGVGGSVGPVSVRLKLALSYAGFLVAAGIALAVLLLLVLRYIPDENIVRLSTGQWVPNRGDLLQVFWRWLPVALLGLAAIGVAGGWLLAGRMLAPLKRIHAAALAVDDGALDHRIRLGGPRDEMRELADAFDAMVARLERTFDEQQRFAANASHELRTPHAVIRTMLEVAQSDPEGTDTAELLRRIDATNERAIASTESLLALARVEREPLVRSRTDLAVIAADHLAEVTGVEVSSALSPAPLRGNAPLLAQAVGNLVRNAVVHNVPDGRLAVRTETVPEGARLTITNTGPVVDPAVASTLTEPFLRAERHGSGSGLGLAIVASIVRVHDGTLDIEARVDGGLRVTVTLPRVAD